MCGALAHVCFGPKADIGDFNDRSRRQLREKQADINVERLALVPRATMPIRPSNVKIPRLLGGVLLLKYLGFQKVILLCVPITRIEASIALPFRHCHKTTAVGPRSNYRLVALDVQ